jgi:hypothetical protein
MPNITLPTSPTVGQNYTFNGQTWTCVFVGPPARWQRSGRGSTDFYAVMKQQALPASETVQLSCDPKNFIKA